jgi:hypothetical protein
VDWLREAANHVEEIDALLLALALSILKGFPQFGHTPIISSPQIMVSIQSFLGAHSS